MTGRPLADPDRRWKLGFGFVVLGSLTVFVGGAFLALIAFAGAGAATNPAALLGDPYVRGVVTFTLEQAALSTALAILGAVPFALALHRLRFPGRSLVLRLLILTQALPVLVGALAILAVWGRGGAISGALTGAGYPKLDIYGLPGILLAHVFFNLPLVTRLILSGLDAVPAETWKLSGQLSLTPAAVFRVVEWPAVRAVLPGAASLVFMLCVTSFTLVLVLGGGPGATTLEVEIYQALNADFDPGRAAMLAIVQIVLTATAVAVLMRAGSEATGVFTPGRPARRFDAASVAVRLGASAIVVAGLLFVATPFAAVVWRGLDADLPRLLSEPQVWKAALTSIAIAASAGALGLVLSAGLLMAAETLRKSPARRDRLRRSLFETAGLLVLVVPPIVLGAGWFLALRATAGVAAAAPAMIVAVNAVMAMPFILRILAPALAASADRHDRLAASLGLRGLGRLRHVEGPALARPLGLAFAYALALSLGDLGAVALFGNQDLVTLPLLLYQRMGSYRTADAAGLALLLGSLTVLLAVLAEAAFARSERLS